MDKLFKYSETEYGFISHEPISEGDDVSVAIDSSGKPITKKVVSIMEQRESNGDWKGAVPQWYRLKVQ